jgi:hypoxanthine phosphoribosyltransferase
MTASSSPPSLSFNTPISSAPWVEPMITESEIATRLDAMAKQINQAYAGCERLIVIGVLKGSFMVLSDLVKRLDMPCQIEFIRLASYGSGTTTSGQVRAVDLSLPSLEGQDVLIIEDIIDTGLTLSFLLQYLASLHQTKSLKVAVLLDKPQARHATVQANTQPDFVGFTIANQFVVGYGLDYDGLYRDLPYVGILHLPDSAGAATDKG